MPVGAFQRELLTHRHCKKDVISYQRNMSLKHIDNIEGSCIWLKPTQAFYLYPSIHRWEFQGVRWLKRRVGGEGIWNSWKLRGGSILPQSSKGDNYSSLVISWLLGRSWLATTDWDYDHYTNNYWWFIRFIPFVNLCHASERSATCTLPGATGVTPRLLNGDGLQFVSELETAQTRADAMCLGACPIQRLSLGNGAWFFLI